MQRNPRVSFLSLTLFALLCPHSAEAQSGTEIPWVRGRIALPVAGDTVELQLTRPSRLPRLELGASRLYESLPLAGELWRSELGAVMQLTAPRDLHVAGQAVPAGDYALFTFPDETAWTFHLVPVGNLIAMPRQDPRTGEVVQLYVPDRRVRTFTVELEEAEVRQLRVMGERQESGGADLVLRAQEAEVRIPFE